MSRKPPRDDDNDNVRTLTVVPKLAMSSTLLGKQLDKHLNASDTTLVSTLNIQALWLAAIADVEEDGSLESKDRHALRFKGLEQLGNLVARSAPHKAAEQSTAAMEKAVHENSGDEAENAGVWRPPRGGQA